MWKLTQTITKMRVCVLSHFTCVWLLVTPWVVACQAPLSMGFFGQEYWSGLPCPPPGDLPNPGIELMSPALVGGFFTHWTTWEAQHQATPQLTLCWAGVPGRRLHLLPAFQRSMSEKRGFPLQTQKAAIMWIHMIVNFTGQVCEILTSEWRLA